MLEVVQRFSGSPERVDILRGLLAYRSMLRTAGIVDGYQWVDGSFVEDCERLNQRAPNDVDVVTFAYRPSQWQDNDEWQIFFDTNDQLFDRVSIKRDHSCDVFYEDLNLPGHILVSRARYWFGLFSHQRASSLWKGMLQIPLQGNDRQAASLLGGK